jgi:tetratricopeptide (TPR) repeat protein
MAQSSAPSSGSSDSAKSTDAPNAPAPKTRPPAKADSGAGGKSATASDKKKDENPQNKFAFPEALSRKAAAEATHQANGAAGASGNVDTAGSSSSNSSSSSSSGSDAAPSGSSTLVLKDMGSNGDDRNPYRAADDIEVADFYYKNGNYMGAYMRYKDAIHYMPDDARAQYGLAQLEEQFGQNDDAIKHYTEYLKLEPEGPKAKDARKALKKLAEKTSQTDSASRK